MHTTHTKQTTHLTVISLATVLATVVSVHAEPLMGTETDEGVFTVPMKGCMQLMGERTAPPPPLSGPNGWTYELDPDIGNAVGLTPEHTWAAVRNSNERLIVFESDGAGVPTYEVPSGPDTPAGVAAARDVDRAAYFDDQNGSYRVRSFTSASSTADWQYVFDANYNLTSERSVAISRDGSVIAAGAEDSSPDENRVIFFDAETGDQISTWTQTGGTLAAVDLTDDGSRAMVTLWDEPHVVDTTTGTTIWSGDGTGAGNVEYRISGDGNVIAVGGFDLEIYQWDGNTYQEIIEFDSGPTEWFGYGVAISSDGSTVGAMSRESGSYTVNVRLWDVDAQQLIGEDTFRGVAGTLQTNPQSADATHDGSMFVFGMWGDGTGAYPEILVYDNEMNQLGEIDMAGSAFDVAISSNGQWVAGTGKAVHANTLGSGGQIVTTQFEIDIVGDLDGDGSVGVNDLLQLLGAWGDCDKPTCPEDLDGDGNIGVNDLLTLLGNWG